MTTMRRAIAAAAGCAALATAAEIKTESFDTDGSYDDYTGSGRIFHSYFTTNSPVAVVEDGMCKMELLPNVDGAVHAVIDFGEAKTLLSLRLDYQATQLAAANSAWTLYFGNFPAEQFDGGWHVYEGARNWAIARVEATDAYTVKAVDGTNATHAVAGFSPGKTYTWSLFFNETGAATTFTGPDKDTYALDTGRWSFFVGETVIGHNLVKGTYGACGYLRGVVIHANRNYLGGTSRNAFDNIVIRDDLKLFAKDKTTVLTVR